MTAEIIIMNKRAVALAADSAATISGGKGRKVFNTANKLFPLGHNLPVGILIYNNASLFGFPMEIIIGLYREFIEEEVASGKAPYATLEEYATGFMNFIKESCRLSIAKQLSYERDKFIKRETKPLIKSICSIMKTELFDIKNVEENVKNFNTLLDDYACKSGLEQVNETNVEEVKARFENIIKEIIIHNVSDDIKDWVLKTNITKLVIISLLNCTSGIAFSGFGKNDLFPKTYRIYFPHILFDGNLSQNFKFTQITLNTNALITPLAQTSDIKTFIEGIHPRVRLQYYKIFEENVVPSIVKELCEKCDSHTKKEIENSIKGTFSTAFASIDNIRRQDFIDPILETTSMLEKDELASMAQTLVNMVSFRKRVTLELETVGGDIDVAIITRAKGFT